MADIPGDTTTTTTLTPGDSLNSEMDFLGDVDMIAVTLTAGLTYSFSISATSGNFNPYMRLVNSSGSTLASDSTISGTTALFSFAPTVTGTYYLRLNDYSNDGIGSYTLSSNGSDSIVDNLSTLTTLAPGGGIGGSLSSSIDVHEDVDVIQTGIVEGLTFSFTVTVTGGDLNPILRLLNGSGLTVESASTVNGNTVTFSYTGSNTGVYFLKLGDYANNGSGQYTIVANANDTVVDNFTTSAVLAPNSTFSSSIDVFEDADVVRVTAVAGLTYGYGATTNNGNLNPYLRLLNASGSTVESAATTNGSAVSFSATTSETGTFYLRLFDYSNNGTGAYILSLNTNDTIVNNLSTSSLLAAGSSMMSAIDVAGDIDIIKTTLSNGTSYGFVLNTAGGAVDPSLALISGSGSTLASTYSSGNYAHLTYAPTAAGDFFIRVAEYGSNDFGSYSLFVYTSGNDNLVGTALSEYIAGGNGNDRIDGGLGADTLVGGNGNDTYFVNMGSDSITETATGGTADTIFSTVSFVNRAGVERLTLLGSGHLNANGINGQNDILTGNTGNNRLFGMSGSDTLSGGAGIDTLSGGLGNDVLFGGSGRDFFRFDTAPNGAINRDAIADFSSRDDTIYLENAVFRGLGAATGFLSAGKFAIGTAAKQADDRIIYNNVTGALLYDADGVGGVAAIQFATINGHPPLSALDFFVV